MLVILYESGGFSDVNNSKRDALSLTSSWRRQSSKLYPDGEESRDQSLLSNLQLPVTVTCWIMFSTLSNGSDVLRAGISAGRSSKASQTYEERLVRMMKAKKITARAYRF